MDRCLLREIHSAWEDEGFAPSNVANRESGERRSAFRQYEDSVDWTDPAQMVRAVLVFEFTLDGASSELATPVERALGKDGWMRDGDVPTRGTVCLTRTPNPVWGPRSESQPRSAPSPVRTHLPESGSTGSGTTRHA